MSEPKQGPSRAVEVDAEGYHVEGRGQTEDYYHTTEVHGNADRTEIHLRDGKTVRLEEVKSKETVRLASPEEVRALLEAEFEGLDEIGAGKEITIEEVIRKETVHEKTVDGKPVVECSYSEGRNSIEEKHDPQWKTTALQYPDQSLDETQAVVVAGEAPCVEVPTIVSLKSGDYDLAAESSVSAVSSTADVSSAPETRTSTLEGSVKGKATGKAGKGKPSKDKSKNKKGIVDMETDEDGSWKESEILEESPSRRHEIRHKRHIIEEVIIEDMDKFYEKQEKRPRLFFKGTVERKKGSPMETSSASHEAPDEDPEIWKRQEKSAQAESLPNITTENVTYVVGHELKASGKADVEGPDKSLKWYSIPRKHDKSKHPEDPEASKSLQRPKTKSQEEMVSFYGVEVEDANRKRGIKFGKGSGEVVMPQKRFTEEVKFVVVNEPAKRDVTSDRPQPKGSSLPPLSKQKEFAPEVNVEPQTLTFVVEQEVGKSEEKPAHEKEHSWSLPWKGASLQPEKYKSKVEVEPQTVTYVVEAKPPETREKEAEQKKQSLNLTGKLEGQLPEKETSKPTPQTELVTFVVEQEVPQAKVKLDKEKEHSWSLLGKFGEHHSEKDLRKPDAELETKTFVVQSDLPEAKVEVEKGKEHSWKLGKIGGTIPEKDAILGTESLTITVETEEPGKANLSNEGDGDKKSWSLKWPTGEKKDRKEKKRFQDEIVVDDTHLYTEDNSLKVKSSPGKIKLDADANIKTEESIHVKAPQVSISPKAKGGASVEGEEKMTFVVEGQVPKVKADVEGEKFGSWKPSGKIHAEKEKPVKKDVAVSETVTFVVEQELPKAEVKLDKGKVHSSSLSGNLGVLPPEKEASKPALQAETVQFVVEHNLPEAKVKLDKEKEHSWSLPGKLGVLPPEKGSRKLKPTAETMQYIVEYDLPQANVKLEKEKEHSMSLPKKVEVLPQGKGTAEAPKIKTQTMKYVVEQEIPEAKLKTEKDKEHSWTLRNKIGGLFSEKTSSKSSLEPETVTYVVEGKPVQTEATLTLEKPKPPTAKLDASLERKDRKGHQEEIVVDDTHLFSASFDTKSKKNSKEPKVKTQPQSESVTFVVTSEKPTVKEPKGLDLSLKAPALEGDVKVSAASEEKFTYIVNEELPRGELKAEVESGEKSWQAPKIALPTFFHKDDHAKPEVEAETVTFVVQEPEIEPKKKKVDSKVEYKTGEVESGEISWKAPKIALPTFFHKDDHAKPEVEVETVTFVVKEPEIEPKKMKDDSKAKVEYKTGDVESGEISWKTPNIALPTFSHKDDHAKPTVEAETVTFVVKETTPEPKKTKDVAKVETKSPQEKPVVPKHKHEVQREVIVDDAHLYTEKTKAHLTPFKKSPGKSGATVQAAGEVEHQNGKKAAGSQPGIVQETVTYTVTTDVAPPDLDTSTGSAKGKPHKWKGFGKKHSKHSEQSGSSGSLPSSREATLPRKQPQEEVVIGGDTYVDVTGSLKRDKTKVPVEGKFKPTEAAVYTVKIEPVAEAELEIPDVQVRKKINVGKMELQTKEEPEAEAQFKFDIGDMKSVENVKPEYLESPETKKIVFVVEHPSIVSKQEELKVEAPVNGFQYDGKATEHVEGSVQPSVDFDRRIDIKFGTSTPKKELPIVSTGAHGDAVQGAESGDHTLDVTGSSDVSICFIPQTEGSLEGSSPTGSRPNSFYAVPAVTGSAPPPLPHIVVIAVDFGTTFSGYAFSFSRDVNSIHVQRKWPDGDPGMVNQKTPTVLLLTPEGQFHSFGFTAKDFYHNLNPREAKQWLYFEKFKMALHYNADLSTKTEIVASNGQSCPALTVFSHALRFFRDHALREVSDQSATRILNEDVRWVITVPAIWKAPAKQFMRQAAYQAGIASQDNPDQLLVALEPEAASIFIRKQQLQQLIPEHALERSVTPVNSEGPSEPVLLDRISQLYTTKEANRLSQCMPSEGLSTSFQRAPSPLYTQVRVGEELDIIGTRYMVADCGGGTVDITVYELDADSGHLNELYKATGGPYGSMGVDLEFEALLVQIFGADFIDVFKAKRPGGWVDLMMAFENRKRAANPIKSKPLNVSLPFSFMDYHKKYRHNTVEWAIRKYNDKDIRWSSQGMMRLMPEAMTRLFQPTLDKVKETIANVLNKPEVKGIKYIFLVGGFAESPMVQVDIRNEFSNLVKILIPADASLAILKGAVCFGCDPAVVKIRKSRMSYGLAVLNRFVRGKHPESKLAYKDGVEWCLDVFDALVRADQSVALGSSVTRSYTPAGPGQKFGNIDLYCSDSNQVQFVDDPGVTNCGKLRLDFSDLDQSETGRRRREVRARMTFGDTEIKVVATDVATGNAVRASIDFLNK